MQAVNRVKFSLMDKEISQEENLPSQSSSNSPIPKLTNHNRKKYILLSAAILFLIAGVSVFLLSNKPKTTQLQTANLNTPEPSVTTASLQELKSIDQLNPNASIKVAFSREGQIYLYEDSKEKLVAKPARETTESACNYLVYPSLSPNGKYLAYIEQIGEKPGYGGCLEGILRVANLDTGKIKATQYKINYFSWNSLNQIVFKPVREINEKPQTYIIKDIFYDPATETELSFNTAINQDKDTWAETMASGEFPFDKNKIIRYKEQKYYLVDKLNSREVFLFDKSQINGFIDWSPSGKYAIFESTKKPTKVSAGLVSEAIELVVDTYDTSIPPKEVTVGRGVAGGDIPTGRKWYFEKGFVAYCKQSLYFVDGNKPLDLTRFGGAGCPNEEGLIATSPNGEYAFVKFSDRFEIHKKTGEKQVINETTKLTKGRGQPKNLVWINNDYMVIFESTYGYLGTNKSNPKIFLFDRKANSIKSLIENAYLISSPD